MFNLLYVTTGTCCTRHVLVTAHDKYSLTSPHKVRVQQCRCHDIDSLSSKENASADDVSVLSDR